MQNRRNFLAKLSILGSASVLSGFKPAGSFASPEMNLSEKVKTAMLAMQRASWEQGTAIQAAIETKDDYLLQLMVNEAILRQSRDGRTCMLGSNNNVTDPVAAGAGIIRCHKITGQQKYKDAADRLYEYCKTRAPRNSEGTLFHLDNSQQLWSDSIYMLPPFLAAYGDFDECMKQIRGYRNFLWNTGKQLYSHRWDCRNNSFISDKCWGGGNGWAIAAFAIIYELLPNDRSDYKKEIAGYIKELSDGLIKHLRADGLFHDIVDDPSSFVETNLSQMAAFGIYKGVKFGILDSGYKEKADKMKAGAISKIDAFGYVRDACGSPSFDKPGTSTEAQAFYLMMEAASNL